MESAISTSKIKEDFLAAAEALESAYVVSLHLMRRKGLRLEFAAGRMIEGDGMLTGGHILDLDSQWAVKVMNWGLLSEKARRHIEASMQLLAIRYHQWTKEELVIALQKDDPCDIGQKADLLREAVCGNEVHRRGLIEFSNYCSRNCSYCGLRRDNRKLTRYRMTEEEIVESSRHAQKLGYRTVVLQSGEDGGLKTEDLCWIIEKIKNRTGLAVTLSVGEKTKEEYRQLKDAGADRYLMRFETSNKALYERLKPGASFGRRLQCLTELRELGYQVGSGCMVGMPGQTLGDLADDLLLMKKLDLDMVGVGPFIPHPETPLKDETQGDFQLTLKFLALVRLVTQNTHIPATTALGSIHPFGRQMALQRGANVIMPNVTPPKYRKFYEIYPNKICITEKPSDCAGCVGSMIHSLGRKIASGPGDSLKVLPAAKD